MKPIAPWAAGGGPAGQGGSLAEPGQGTGKDGARTALEGPRPAASRLRLVIAIAVLLGAGGPLMLDRALRAPIHLDENTGLERVVKSPADFSLPIDYWYAIDHPAVSRWLHWGVLRALKVEIGEIPSIDVTRSRGWNIANGRAAPRKPVNVLRAANSVALTLSVLTLFFVARAAVGGVAWGLVLAAPLVLVPDLGRYCGGYVLADAHLALILALVCLAWLRFHLTGRPLAWLRISAMGALVGAAVATKLNAGLLLPAYAAYLVLLPVSQTSSTGVAGAELGTHDAPRLVNALRRPLALRGAALRLAVFLAASFAAYVALNPVMWRGGPVWWFQVAGDMLSRRWIVVAQHKQIYGPSTWMTRLQFLFPMWYLLAPLALLAWHSRRERWFLPVALWAGLFAVGTALTINQPFPRYRMPVDLALVTLGILSLASVVRRCRRGDFTGRELLLIGQLPRTRPTSNTHTQ